MRNPDFVVCKQHMRRPASASVQFDQHLCCSLIGKNYIKTCYMRTVNNLASLSSSPSVLSFTWLLNGKPCLEVIKLEYILKFKIKHNDWLFADTCPQAANHCALF